MMKGTGTSQPATRSPLGASWLRHARGKQVAYGLGSTEADDKGYDCGLRGFRPKSLSPMRGTTTHSSPTIVPDKNIISSNSRLAQVLSKPQPNCTSIVLITRSGKVQDRVAPTLSTSCGTRMPLRNDLKCRVEAPCEANVELGLPLNKHSADRTGKRSAALRG